MHTAITVLHVLACLFLIIVILLQTGKGGDMGAAFGGSSSSTFGGQGAGTFLSKTTAVVAGLFMLTSLSLAILSSRVDKESVISDDVVPLQQTAPGLPPVRPRMEPDPEAFKVKTTPIAGSAEPVTAPQSAQKETSAIPAAKAVPVTTETQNNPEASQKDETTAPAPKPATP